MDDEKQEIIEQNVELLDLDLQEKHHKLNVSLFKTIISYVVSSLLYIVLSAIDGKKNLSIIKTEFENSLLHSLMIVFYVITTVCIVCYIIYLLSKKAKIKLNSIDIKKKKRITDLLDFFSVFPISIALVSLCFSCFFFIANVDGQSMEYTIIDEQKAFVSYHSKIEQFDIVVLYVCDEDNTMYVTNFEDYYIKRIIGIPGDKLTWNNGILSINGQVVEESYLSSESINHNKKDNNNFNGTFHYVGEDGSTIYTDVIPEGYYFVMGDNRGVSRDSRSIGLIKKENIVGKVKFFFGKGKTK